MKLQRMSLTGILPIILLGFLPTIVIGDQILQTSSFSSCLDNSNITVSKVDITYNNDNKTITFNVAGISKSVQNVTAVLNVTAYGNSVYSNTFNPCEPATFVQQLCPVPSGSFSAYGSQAIPAKYASLVPAIAFQVPDIAAQATLQLKSLDTGKNVACIQSEVTNGKTVDIPAISYIAMGIGGAALLLAGVSSAVGAAASGSAGGGTISPSFSQVVGVFQGFAINGMMSVSYPPVYRSFAKNFGFSTGLVSWTTMQTSIDNFRSMTGGNLTDANIQFMKNATMIYTDNASSDDSQKVLPRALHNLLNGLESRQTVTRTNAAAPSSTEPDVLNQIELKVSGITAYIEQYYLPQSNAFMTVLLVVSIVIAVIIVGILLLKVVLETWALFGSFPKKLTGFRKHYWGTMARLIVQLILILYGIWALYCVFQFTHGDSWAAKALAGVTLGIFTGILMFFTFKIWQAAHRFKKGDGDVSKLYEDKETWVKYSLFYDGYKKNFWWTFVPVIIYMFVKGALVAGLDGHGFAQTIAQIVVESLMLGLLIFARPFERRSGNVIGIFIQVVRVLSVICILVFVQELGISQTTQTVTGVVLIAVQSGLTVMLCILLVTNSIIICCKANPHRKRRKEAEKLNRDVDDLTPLDARNSLLTGPQKPSPPPYNPASNMSTSWDSEPKLPYMSKQSSNTSFASSYTPASGNPYADAKTSMPLNSWASLPGAGHRRGAESMENLMDSAAPFTSNVGGTGLSPPPRGFYGSPPQQGVHGRQPMAAEIGTGGYGGYRGAAY